MIAALFGVGVLTGEGSDPPGEPSEGSDPSHEVDRVARRLERVRQLEFERIPPVRTVSAEEARDEGLAVLDEEYPPERRGDDEEILTMLGLLPEGSDLRELAGTVFGEEVAGFYDDETKQMTLVAGFGEGTQGEITLAHELTHALEDQHFDLGIEGGLDDHRTARSALVEGTATVAMVDYLARFLTGGIVGRDQALAQLQTADVLESDSGLPPYLQHSLLFPYTAGSRFVNVIGTWRPANNALRSTGPESTEQILHPDKYRARERALPVEASRPPGKGWKKDAAGTIGEFDTSELIRSSDSPERAVRAAAGWGGGAYALWQRDRESALTLAWRWDTPRDAAEFVSALPRYIERSLEGRRTEVDVGPTVRLTIRPAQ
ncbi:MAG: hypothetical protein ACRDJY_09180 [Thermoleophilaceae bacterium]